MNLSLSLRLKLRFNLRHARSELAGPLSKQRGLTPLLGEGKGEEVNKNLRPRSAYTHSLVFKNSSYNFASGDPTCGCQSYCQATNGGSDIKIDSVRPPD